VRFFLDTEFFEEGSTLTLISIGIAAESGAGFYAVNTDFDEANYLKPGNGQWLKQNVRPLLMKLPPDQDAELQTMPLDEIAPAVRKWVVGQARGSIPMFWAYFASYDWYIFCQLFGGMMNLPKGWPQFCCDVAQTMHERNIKREYLPKQDAAWKHHALADAMWLRAAWVAAEMMK
jgi:hypothetical protein